MNTTDLLLSLIDKELWALRERIIKNSMAAGQRASGDTYKSMGIQSDETSSSLYGKGFFAVLETGRKPGKQPPITSILQWIKSKGVVPDKGSELSMAFGIAKSIGKEGSSLFKAGGRTDIFTNEIDKLIKELPERIGDKLIFNIGEFIGASSNK